MNTPSHLIRPIHFEKKTARLDVPHYRLVGVLLHQGSILFRFDGFRVVVKGENMAVLFAKFGERRVWWLEEGREVQFAGSQDKYVISHIRFHGTEIDRLDEGPVSRYATAEVLTEVGPLAAVPLIRFEQSGQGMKLALPLNNLLQMVSDAKAIGMLFEHWRVKLTGKGMPLLYNALRDSNVRVVSEGVVMESEDGKFAFQVEDMQFTDEEE
jgi:hypothetical protein